MSGITLNIILDRIETLVQSLFFGIAWDTFFSVILRYAYIIFQLITMHQLSQRQAARQQLLGPLPDRCSYQQ